MDRPSCLATGACDCAERPTDRTSPDLHDSVWYIVDGQRLGGPEQRPACHGRRRRTETLNASRDPRLLVRRVEESLMSWDGSFNRLPGSAQESAGRTSAASSRVGVALDLLRVRLELLGFESLGPGHRLLDLGADVRHSNDDKARPRRHRYLARLRRIA